MSRLSLDQFVASPFVDFHNFRILHHLGSSLHKEAGHSHYLRITGAGKDKQGVALCMYRMYAVCEGFLLTLCHILAIFSLSIAGRGCSTHIGYGGYSAFVSLAIASGCATHQTSMHEFGHSLGELVFVVCDEKETLPSA